MADQHSVKPGQVYASCDPRGGPRIRIVDYTPGTSRADVVDADDGSRPRSVLVAALHASGRRPGGQERRTGYRLVSEPDQREGGHA